jgi:Cu-processing system ATP-binding protein
VIAFRGFSKRYGDITAVDDLSLEIGAGEIVALLGPNGSGKTTTLKAVAGLLGPSQGSVLVGDPLRPAVEPAARAAISFLPQRVTFADAFTASEIVAFYCGLRRVPPSRGEEVLRFAALNGASDRAVRGYSGGMLQRLGLAVAMIPREAALVLDEPAEGLDPTGVVTFYEALQERRRAGGTVLFSTHRVGGIEALADRFAILIRGRLVANLTAAELQGRLESAGVLRLAIPERQDEALAIARDVSAAASVAAGVLTVPVAPARRPALLDRLRAGGIAITALSATERSLEDLYRDLVRDADAQSRDDDNEVPGGQPISAEQVFETARIPDEPAK